ncbi:MAG: YbjN domain-containing protein [Actinomycetales bacterium]|nr:YbjN domain-containing protein [Actinomycetales bacterium]
MSAPSDEPYTVPTPVTFERLLAHLESGDVHVQPSGPAAVRGRWGENLLELSLRSSAVVVLQVKGARTEPLPESAAPALVTFANDWHREHIWPTVCWTSAGDGVEVHTVFAADVTEGASDAQLRDTFTIGIATTNQCLTALTDALAR